LRCEDTPSGCSPFRWKIFSEFYSRCFIIVRFECFYLTKSFSYQICRGGSLGPTPSSQADLDDTNEENEEDVGDDFGELEREFEQREENTNDGEWDRARGRVRGERWDGVGVEEGGVEYEGRYMTVSDILGAALYWACVLYAPLLSPPLSLSPSLPLSLSLFPLS
jgi:hypothetical protein